MTLTERIERAARALWIADSPLHAAYFEDTPESERDEYRQVARRILRAAAPEFFKKDKP